MVPKEYIGILGALRRKTDTNAVTWSQGVGTDDFVTSFGVYALQVSRASTYDINNDEQVHVSFSLRSSSGDELDSFSVYEGSAEFSLAIELFNGARRSALKINDALRVLRTTLGVKPEDEKVDSVRPANDDDLPF